MYSNNIFDQAKNSIDIRSTVIGLLPRGKKEGNEWVALNPIRSDKNLGSFRINLNNGKWIDHATGDKGSDIISLYAYLGGISQKEAAHSLLGNGLNFKNQSFTYNPPKVPKPPKVDIIPITLNKMA